MVNIMTNPYSDGSRTHKITAKHEDCVHNTQQPGESWYLDLYSAFVSSYYTIDQWKEALLENRRALCVLDRSATVKTFMKDYRYYQHTTTEILLDVTFPSNCKVQNLILRHHKFSSATTQRIL